MDYRCARCHTRFSPPPAGEGASEGHSHHLACPKCKAEAGLEPVKKVPLPMALFGAFLGLALAATVVGGFLSHGVG